MNTCSETLVGRVRYYLECKYDIKYNSKFTYVVNEDTDEYRLMWHLNDQDHPLIMQGQFLSEDSFFNYVCKEIDAKKPFFVKYFIARRVDPNLDKDGNIQIDEHGNVRILR